MELNRDAQDYLGTLASQPGARQPATFTEIWNSEWTRTGLDTIGGVGKPFADAYQDLSDKIVAEGGAPIDELARRHGVNLGGAVTRDGRVAALGAIADALPEDARKRLEPFRDVRKRASDAALAIEKEASDVAGSTYGLSGIATSFLAGVARQTVDPANIAAMIATAPVGGPLEGPILRVIGRQALAGGAAQLAVEPYVQATRAELGLEHGVAKGAGDVFEAALGGGALAGLFRGSAAVLRAVRPRPAAQPPLGDWSGEPAFTGHDFDPSAFDRGRVYPADPSRPLGDVGDLAGPGGNFDIAVAAQARPVRTRAPEPDVPASDLNVSPISADDVAGLDRGRVYPPDTSRGLGHVGDLPGIVGNIDLEAGARARPTTDRLPPEAPRPPSDQPLSPIGAEDVAALDRGATGIPHEPVALGEMADTGGGFDIDVRSASRAFDAVAAEDVAAAAQLAERDHVIHNAIAGETPELTAARHVALEETAQAMEAGRELVPPPARQPVRYGPASRPPEKYSLFEFLVSHGGLNPDQPAAAQGWVQKILGENPNVPFFGKLIRDGGLTLDRAWREAAMAGYLDDAGMRSGGVDITSINDLLRLIDEEGRGNKQYRMGQGATPALDREAERATLERHREGLAADFDARMTALEIHKPEPELRTRALAIMEREGVKDPLAAYEKALLERDERSEAIRRARQSEAIDIPGWDLPADAGRAPPHGEPAAPGQPERSGEPGQRQSARPGREGDRAAPEGQPDKLGGEQLGDPALQQDAERALAAQGGDLEITLQLPDGSLRKVSARQALAEAEADAKAAAELSQCIGTELKPGGGT